MKVDKRTAEDIKHRLPCITHPACSSRETPRSWLTSGRKPIGWCRYAARGSPILGNSASEIFFYLSEIFPYLSEGFSYYSERFYSTRQKKEATDKNRLKRTNYDRRQKLREGRARHALLSHRYPQGSAQPAGEMDQPVSRAQAEPLFRLRRQVFPLLHPATSSRNHRIFGWTIKKTPWKRMHTTHYAYPFLGWVNKNYNHSNKTINFTFFSKKKGLCNSGLKAKSTTFECC